MITFILIFAIFGFMTKTVDGLYGGTKKTMADANSNSPNSAMPAELKDSLPEVVDEVEENVTNVNNVDDKQLSDEQLNNSIPFEDTPKLNLSCIEGS